MAPSSQELEPPANPERFTFFKILKGQLILRPVARARRDLDETQRLQHPAHGAYVQRDLELFPELLRKVLQAPAHHPMDRRDRPALDQRRERPALGLVQFGRGAGRFAVDQTSRPFGVETQSPIANDLKANPAKRRRLAATATFVNHRQAKQAARLIGILRGLRKRPKPCAVIVISQCLRCYLGYPRSMFHGESHTIVAAQPFYESASPQVGIIQLFAATPEAQDPRRKELIAHALEDLTRLCDRAKEPS